MKPSSSPGAQRGAAIPIVYRLLLLAVLGLALGFATKWWRDGSQLQVIEYPMQEKLDIPTAIAVARDGAVWFTIDGADAVGFIHEGKLRRLSKGSRSVEPMGIGVDSAGDAWITDAPAVAVKRITRAGALSSVPLGTAIARLTRLAVGPDDAVWFAESTAYSVTRLKGGELKRHEIQSLRGSPFGVAVAQDGTAWATLQAGNSLLRIGTDGKTTEFEVPTRAASPTDVAVDAKGRPWFIEFRGNKVGYLEDGRFVEYDVPHPSAALSGLAIAPDGAAWFGLIKANALGRVRDGEVRVFPLARKNARPFSLAADGAGNIWYADITGFVGMVPAAEAAR